MKIQINPFVSRMLSGHGVILPKLQSALDSAYNQGTKLDIEASKGPKITGAVANEKKGTFTAREVDGKVRTGKLTDPLRFVAWNQALTAFYSKQGEPSGEITVSSMPAGLRAWIDNTMRQAGKRKGKVNGKLTLPARANTPAPEHGTVANGAK